MNQMKKTKEELIDMLDEHLTKQQNRTAAGPADDDDASASTEMEFLN